MWAWIARAAWLTVGIYSATHYKPDTSAFDLRRCYVEHQFTYWDGPIGRPTPSTYRSLRHCWPKDGVFMNGDAALAWRVAQVKPKETTR